MEQLSSQEIRDALIARALAYCDAANTSLSAIGTAAVNDSKFLARVRNGENFNIGTYQKVVDWLTAAEAERAQRTAAE